MACVPTPYWCRSNDHKQVKKAASGEVLNLDKHHIGVLGTKCPTKSKKVDIIAICFQNYAMTVLLSNSHPNLLYLSQNLNYPFAVNTGTLSTWKS